jgi:hypothetical protein
MMRYTKLYFADDGLDMYHEVGTDGYAARFAVIDRSTGDAVTASSRDELRGLSSSQRAAYESQFGAIPTLRPEGDVPPPSHLEPISQDEFEQAWTFARSQLA